MKQIFRTKTTIPIIFDYYPDKYMIELSDLGRVSVSGEDGIKFRGHNQAELNKNFSKIDQTFFNIFYFASGKFILGRGIFFGKGITAVIYKEDGQIKGAYTITHEISASKKTLINKFFKSYGIKLKDVVHLEFVDFRNKFIFPLKFGLSDVLSDAQKTMSSEFIKHRRKLIPISTEEAVEVFSVPDIPRTNE